MTAALTLERIADLMHVIGVHRRPEALVRLVVGHRVAHVLAHPLVVVAEHGLAHEDELLATLVANLVGKVAQTAQVGLVQAEGHVEAQAIDVIVANPTADDAVQIGVQALAPVVELDEVGHALPRRVREAVAILVVAAKVDLEPVNVRALLAALEHVPEGPEAATHVVEHAVQKHADALLVAGVHDVAKIVRGTQAAVNLGVVVGVIAVRAALEDRVQNETVGAQARHVVHPAVIHNLTQTMHEHAVVFMRGAHKADGIDLIERRRVKPARSSHAWIPSLGDQSILREKRYLAKRAGQGPRHGAAPAHEAVRGSPIRRPRSRASPLPRSRQKSGR